MKKMIVDVNTRAILFIGNRADVTEYGVDVGGIIFPYVNQYEIIDIETVPDGVAVSKSCYDATTGFYDNPNYVQEVNAKSVADTANAKAADLGRQMAKVLLALAKSNIKVV